MFYTKHPDVKEQQIKQIVNIIPDSPPLLPVAKHRTVNGNELADLLIRNMNYKGSPGAELIG